MLDAYERTFDPVRHVVCLDDTSHQLLADARPTLPPAPENPGQHDPEYVHGRLANLFHTYETLCGCRYMMVGD